MQYGFHQFYISRSLAVYAVRLTDSRSVWRFIFMFESSSSTRLFPPVHFMGELINLSFKLYDVIFFSSISFSAPEGPFLNTSDAFSRNSCFHQLSTTGLISYLDAISLIVTASDRISSTTLALNSAV